LTIEPPSIAITSPKPYASTTSQIFSGTATSAPLFPDVPPNFTRLTGVNYQILNTFNGSNITGTAPFTPGTNGGSDWSFTAIPFPGTNILTVESVDASGDVSATASRTFFYEVPARLTILKTGSGTGTFTIANAAMLNLGQGYSITARPLASVFSNWIVGGATSNIGRITSYEPTVQFVMQSNLILTADFMARRLPKVVMSSPKDHERSGSLVFDGTAATSPVLSGANPTNLQLANVVYWLSNGLTGSVITGVAALTNGNTVSNWSIAVTNLPGTSRPAVQSASNGLAPVLPGTNTLFVQVGDVSGGFSSIVSRTFFYKVPALFTRTNAGNGNGTVLATALVAGDTPPTNGAMLNVGERYKLTAKPDKLSLFVNWLGSPGASTNAPVNSFIMQSNLVLTATFVEIPPVVTISSPAANLRTAAPVFTGTASGHFPIANVICALANTNGLATLTAGANAVSNWSVALVPLPGTNYLSAYCVDANGNRSASIYREFFYNVPARLTLTKAGSGGGSFKGAALVAGNTPPADGAMLNIGEGYKVTALPDKASLFSNWISAVGANALATSDEPALSFVMQSNLVLTAAFVTNFFPPVAGVYNGLFFPPAAPVRVQTSGMLYNLALRGTGAFSGKFLAAGMSYPFATNFDISGNASFEAGPLQVELTLVTGTQQIIGTISEAGTTAVLIADLASNTLPSTEYTMLFSPTLSANDSPPGDGYVLVTNHEGVVTLSGALADGTRYSQTVPVSQAGDVPVYASLCTKAASTNRGLLLGWINLTNLQAAAPTNTLTWIKQKQLFSSPTLYTNGFTNLLSTRGAPWMAPPAGTPALSFTNGELLLSNTDLFLAFTNVSVNDDGLVDAGGLPTNSLSGSINPKTGLLTLVFGDGHGHATESAFGALLQDTTNAGGFFLSTTNAGYMELQP
jgi:hypothetical protein